MIQYIRELKRSAVYGTWRKSPPHRDGYTIVLATPMDMPFLLDLALSTIAAQQTQRCQEILVVPDGSRKDGRELKEVIRKVKDGRVRYVDLSLKWRTLMPYIHNHPAMMALAADVCKSKYAFIHDLDAFPVDRSFIESLYSELLDRGMFAMGIEKRWDRFFDKQNLSIPGTWELFYEVGWLKRWPKQMVFGRSSIINGESVEFDSMLYPMYLDYKSNRIGVTRGENSVVHFNGTVRTFRVYQQRRNQQVKDRMFRLLLLSLLENCFGGHSIKRATPTVETLQIGLNDACAPVVYNDEINKRGYPEFRHMIDEMLMAPVFSPEKSDQILRMLQPFDSHFEYDPDLPYKCALEAGSYNRNGL